MVQYKITSPKCKRCHREPSIMGKEPMYLAPAGYAYFVLCGTCFNKLITKFNGITANKLDLSNLFTHSDEYHNFVVDFLRIKRE